MLKRRGALRKTGVRPQSVGLAPIAAIGKILRERLAVLEGTQPLTGGPLAVLSCGVAIQIGQVAMLGGLRWLTCSAPPDVTTEPCATGLTPGARS
jgi:hypothetical protein